MSAPPFDIANWDGSVATLPPLSELKVHPGTMVAAESILMSFDGPQVEQHVLEWLIAAIVLFERLRVEKRMAGQSDSQTYVALKP